MNAQTKLSLKHSTMHAADSSPSLPRPPLIKRLIPRVPNIASSPPLPPPLLLSSSPPLPLFVLLHHVSSSSC
eukprot:357319-Hanusia_phi.AAC.7